MVASISSPAPSACPAARIVLARQEARHDAALVQRFNAGDQVAFVEIVTRYRSKLRHAAQGLLRNRADAEEIAQDAFVRAHRNLARFRGDSSLAVWLYCITLNLARNRYWYFFRRRHHAMVPLEAPLGEHGSATFAELVASDAPSPVREVVNNEFAAIISRCTDQLPASQRKILTLRNVQHHSYASISRILGIEIGTAKSRIARARVSLRLLVAQAYPEFGSGGSSIDCFEPSHWSGRLVRDT